jgi:glycosyltransferase involved in cell wall biosynthesis
MASPFGARRLSVALIVRDAEPALAETLASIQDVADEIVVLDTGSTDASREVAAQFQARVLPFPWDDDFAAARNACLDNVTGDWVLWLDAGERLSPSDAAGLREFVDREADKKTAYAMLVQVPARDADETTEQVARIRLVPRRPGIAFSGRVRESLLETLGQQSIQLDGLSYRIQRGMDEHDPLAKASRARRNIRLADREIRERGMQARLLNCLGDAMHTLEDNGRAAEFFRHALAASRPGSEDMLEAYYGLITSLPGDGSRREEQLSSCVEAIGVFALDAQLLCAMGGYLQSQGRIDLALKAFRTACDHGQINPYVWHVAQIRDVAAVCAAACLQLQGQTDEARNILQEALRRNPESGRLRRRLLELCVQQGDWQSARPHAERLGRDAEYSEAMRRAVRGACHAARQEWNAAKQQLLSAHTDGCHDPICLRWLALTLVATRDVDQARSVVEQWHELEPDNTEAARILEGIKAAAHSPVDAERALRIDTPSGPTSTNRDSATDSGPSAPPPSHDAPRRRVPNRRAGNR